MFEKTVGLRQKINISVPFCYPGFAMAFILLLFLLHEHSTTSSKNKTLNHKSTKLEQPISSWITFIPYCYFYSDAKHIYNNLYIN